MKNIVLALVAVMALAIGQNVWAYDPDALDYSFGTVKKVSPTEITLEEYDFEGDLENTLNVTYVINEKTELDNFEKIGDLKVDEDVEVYFVEENGKKVAVSLAKDEGLQNADFEDEDLMTDDAAKGEDAGQPDAAAKTAAEPVQQ